MALKQIILAKQISEKELEINSLREKSADFDTREKQLERAIEEAKTDEEIKVVDEHVDEFNEEKRAHEESITTAEKELEALRSQLAELNKKEPKPKKEEKKMGKRTAEELAEIRSGINKFVKSKGQERAAGFTSVEGGALIPEELLTPEEKPEDVVDLKNYVKVVTVTSSNGKYPVISKSGSKMNTVEELAQNPQLANPVIDEIDYKVATRRGYIPVSQEAIDDADYDVVDLIRDEINSQSINTTNADIAMAFKEMPAKEVTGLDGLKDLVNKGIKKVYNIKHFLSASLFAELDKLKDKNGRYLLQDSINAASGKTLFGKEVVVLDDDVIGTSEGDLVGFVGDGKAAVKFFDRKRVSVEWIDNQIYGKLLAGIIRYDVQNTDEEAGFYITWIPTEE